MSNTEKKKEAMRHEIMIHMKANGVAVTGKRWINLIFLSESGLREMCSILSITVK